MTTKKSYSRYFIILQEEERGYSLASDKLPSGYAKFEIKNDKCRVTYYVQNLKKETGPYHMILICNKKDTKKVIKLGELNIDDHGRTEVVYEYNSEDIDSSGIGVEKVVGAAIVKLANTNIIPVMVGFITTEPQDDWKKYSLFFKRENELIEEPIVEKREQELKESVEEPILERQQENQLEDELQEAEVQVEEINSIVAEPVIKEDDPIVETLMQSDRKVDVEIIEEKTIFDSYEENIESIKEDTGRMKQGTESIIQDTDSRVEDSESIIQDTDCRVEDSETIIQDTEGISEDIENIIQDTESIREDIEAIIQDTDSVIQDTEREIEESNRSDDFPKGAIGDYFKMVAKGLEEVDGVCEEIKRCKWYKVNIRDKKDLCDISDYNKYSVIYYPMYSYFRYIKKYRHVLLGYKYDNVGRMKYIVFAIPGKKSIMEQPFEGRSGFVTWVPLRPGEEMEESLGYWLMFYDFRNRTIAIPIKV